LLAIGLGAQKANADEGMVPLAQGGNWAALAYHSSMLAPPDVCVVVNKINPSQMLLFRADEDEIEVRVVDEQWQLPASVAGAIKVTVGEWSGTFDVSHNSDRREDADLSKADLSAMVSAMDKAGSMTVNVGDTKAIVISLTGSTSPQFSY
jgi:hypothetical protein